MAENFVVVKLDEVVMFVLSGRRNEDFPSELRGNKDRHAVNTDMNRIRKFFEDQPRTKEFILELLKVSDVKTVEMKMKTFMRLSKPLQVLAIKLIRSKVTKNEVEELIVSISASKEKVTI